MLIVISGLPATGKTTLTAALSRHVGAVHLWQSPVELAPVTDPNRAGTNTLHLFVFGVDQPGQPSEDVADLSLELTNLDEDLGPIRIDPNFAGPRHWLVISDDLVFPGEWQIRVVAGFDRFTEKSTQLTLPVAP